MVKATKDEIEAQLKPRAAQKKILVIDDNVDLLLLNKTILELGDYEVFTARSGKEALALLSQIALPNLILLDLRMEDMSGQDFLSLLELQKPDIIRDVPIVLLTAMDSVPETKAVGFIRKPAGIDKLLKAVQGFIEVKASGGFNANDPY